MNTRPDLFVEPLSLLASELSEIAAKIQTLQDAHSARIEAAATRLQDGLQEQISTELRQRLECEFQEGTRVIRAEFEERIRQSTEQWMLERASMQSEIANLRAASDRRELLLEVAQTEAALTELKTKIQSMVDDPTVAMSKLVRASAREAELGAYLKGLQFKAGATSASLDGSNVEDGHAVPVSETPAVK